MSVIEESLKAGTNGSEADWRKRRSPVRHLVPPAGLTGMTR